MEEKKKKYLLKVVMVGDSGTGKTSLLQQYVNKKFSTSYKITIGADFLAKEMRLDGNDITIQIWDTAGQDRFSSLGRAFYRGSDCCILVFDVTSRKSFSNISTWRHEFLIQAAPASPKEYPFVVFGNKVDMPQASREVTPAQAAEFCKANNDHVEFKYYETSAKENINVEEAFLHIAQQYLKSEDKHEEIKPTIALDKKATQAEPCAC